jgi:hypothetical protein
VTTAWNLTPQTLQSQALVIIHTSSNWQKRWVQADIKNVLDPALSALLEFKQHTQFWL